MSFGHLKKVCHLRSCAPMALPDVIMLQPLELSSEEAAGATNGKRKRKANRDSGPTSKKQKASKSASPGSPQAAENMDREERNPFLSPGSTEDEEIRRSASPEDLQSARYGIEMLRARWNKLHSFVILLQGRSSR
jgi:hypothetical protein